MNPIITEQLNKFKNGDFGGYESFYNETVSTVYTMLHTVVHDSNVATSLVPQVYDKIYQNVTSLEQTNGFYQWAAELANEEALGYLKENGWTEIHNDSVATVYKGNIIKNLIMDCQSYTKYRPNETTGGIFVSWRRKEELPTGA